MTKHKCRRSRIVRAFLVYRTLHILMHVLYECGHMPTEAATPHSPFNLTTTSLHTLRISRHALPQHNSPTATRTLHPRTTQLSIYIPPHNIPPLLTPLRHAALFFQPHSNVTSHTPKLAPRTATAQFTNFYSTSPPDTDTAGHLRSAAHYSSIADTTEKWKQPHL